MTRESSDGWLAEQGFRIGARRREQAEQMNRRELELAAGHADVRWSGYVTVTGRLRIRRPRGPGRGSQRGPQSRRYPTPGPPWRTTHRLHSSGLADRDRAVVMIATALLAVACVSGMAVVLAWATHRKARGSPSVDAHEATTAHAELLYPFQTSGGLQAPGVFIGRVTTGWAPFTFDPWELYRRGVVTNANMVVAGQIGRGKSAFVKSLIWRNAAFGRKAVVIDPKGEYQPLVE